MQNPIMITGAMEDVELNILKESLGNLKTVEDKVCTFYEGTINDYPIVLCLTGVGMVNAAVATTIAINRYEPVAIIVQGTAGAHSKAVHKYDIVVSTDVININSMKTLVKKEGEGINVYDWELLSYKHNDDKFLALQADEKLINVAKMISKNYENGNVFFGRVGSGDVWNREADRILLFNERYSTLCEEMESYAVFQVANKYEIPAVSIRVISNNELCEEGYDRLSGYNSQEFTIDLVREYINNIE